MVLSTPPLIAIITFLSIISALQSLFKVSYQVLGMFGPYGQPDGIRTYARFQQLPFVYLGMSGACGMDHQSFNVCYIGEKGKELKPVNKSSGLLPAAQNIEGKDRAAAAGEILAI